MDSDNYITHIVPATSAQDFVMRHVCMRHISSRSGFRCFDLSGVIWNAFRWPLELCCGELWCDGVSHAGLSRLRWRMTLLGSVVQECCHFVWNPPITLSRSQNFVLTGSDGNSCIVILSSGILSGVVLHVGIVIAQLGFFTSYWYLAYPYWGVDAFDAILSLWLERQTTDGVVSLLRLWIGSCFNSNYFTNGGFAWKLIPLKETLQNKIYMEITRVLQLYFFLFCYFSWVH